MIKRVLLLATMALASFLLASTPATGNFGPHGAFFADTDLCAACHRSHTGTSSISWINPWDDGDRDSALVSTTAETIQQFCLSCHGEDGAGAATDVENGVFDAVTYAPTESDASIGAILNGGGFLRTGYAAPSTSTHSFDGSSQTAWGGGNGGPGSTIAIDCGTCHDVHGTSNYRLLKGLVNGHIVGGYLGGETAIETGIDPPPIPFVLSNETGFPSEGFRLHEETPGYLPNYTTARYGKPLDAGGDDPEKGMSGWCAACHEQYLGRASEYNPGDDSGSDLHYRHPVNVPISNWYARANPDTPWDNGALIFDPTAWQRAFPDVPFVDIPLEHNPGDESGPLSAGGQKADVDDYIGCLTCHRAHGTAAKMNGYSNVEDAFSPEPAKSNPNTGDGGVKPADDSALLRANNRGVCERCHNK